MSDPTPGLEPNGHTLTDDCLYSATLCGAHPAQQHIKEHPGS